MTGLGKESDLLRAADPVPSGSEPSSIDPEVVLELGDADVADALRELRWRLPLLLNRSPGRVVVDLSEMTQPSSATVAALLWIKSWCRKRSVVVVLRKPSRRSIEMLRRTGLQSALPLEKPDAGRGARCGAASRAPRPVR
jgi:anti-anti-sigma regulatory factor